MTNKTSSSMSKLLANASKMEKEIKETEKVADTISSESADGQSKEETKADHQDTVSEKEILPEKRRQLKQREPEPRIKNRSISCSSRTKKSRRQKSSAFLKKPIRN